MKKKKLGDNLSKLNIETLMKFEKFYKRNNNKINSAEEFPIFITREKLMYYLVKYQLYLKTLNIKLTFILLHEQKIKFLKFSKSQKRTTTP